MSNARYPSLLQINTRVWLADISHALGRAATLDDIPDAEMDRLAQQGFDWVWLLSVWQTGLAGRRVARSSPELRKAIQETLPDLREDDIQGSGFAITGYTVSTSLGGDAALARMRDRLRQRGLRLMLDFVPNHVALDHPWVEDHPEYFVQASELDLARAPQNYAWVQRKRGDLFLAHGRDPNFPPWTDTLQLDYANPATQEAMLGELLKVAGQCDGVRCDMAMLLLPEIFERTWGRRPRVFWPDAIQRVRERVAGFVFLAEVYWDLEWTMQQQGFDYTYDKRLYDRLRAGQARPVREHFLANLTYQDKLVRFLENHDEPRAATTLPLPMHKAAAVITYLSPGLRFVHQGQLEGRRKHIPVQLARGPDEPTDPEIETFYEQILALLRRPILRDGQWRLLDCAPASNGDASWESVIAFAWQAQVDKLIVAVNYSPTQSRCRVMLPSPELGLDMAPWQASIISHDQKAEVL